MKPINTALCTYDLSGKIFHAPFIDLHPRFQLLGTWKRNKKLNQKHYFQVKSYPDLPTLLSDDVFELVVVNTPNCSYLEYTKQALIADKHVIVEKVTPTVAEAKELQLVQEQGKTLSVYQNCRWDSDFKTVNAIA